MLLGFLVMAMVPLSILSLIIYSVIYCCRRKNEGKQSFGCHFVRFLLIGCILSLVYLTIFWGGFDFGEIYHLLNLHPFIWLTQTYEMGYSKMLKQLLTNVVMFIPYGVLLPLVFTKVRKWWKTDVIVFGTSFLIEFIQYFIGRSCDVDDLIMNTIGGCLGYSLFCLVDAICKNKKWYGNLLGRNN